MGMIGASHLDRQITVERATYTTDASGAEIPTWAALATVACAFRPISDSERWRASEVSATVTTRFTIRHGLGVLPTDRLIFEGRTFDIHGVKEVGDRRRFEEITATARAE